jgi:hypothetical protein
METISKKVGKKVSIKSAKNELQEQQPTRKSAIALFRAKYPKGILTIINERAVLR